MGRSKNHEHAASVCDAEAIRLEAQRPGYLCAERDRIQLAANKMRGIARWHLARAAIARATGEQG